MNYLVIFFLFFSISVYSQDIEISIDEGPALIDSPNLDSPLIEVFQFVEVMPEFPGGQDSMKKYISDHLRYPAIAYENDIEGKVIINVIIQPDGSLFRANVISGIKYGCDEEALRIVKSMPKWKPGKQNGVAVPVYFNITIVFKTY